MGRLGVIVSVLAGFALLGGCADQIKKQSTDSDSIKPNIIFVLTDDQRWDALGYAGNSIILKMLL